MKKTENSMPQSRSSHKKRVIVLGNCVAERLQYMLASSGEFRDSFELVRSPMIHLLEKAEEWEKLAKTARSCDIIFTQPLFSFGPCNTRPLRESLSENQRLLVFSSPHFEAYFPDAIVLQNKTNLRIPALLDWDSSIIFSCYVEGISVFEVEDVYLRHPLFHKDSMQGLLHSSLESYARRETELDLRSSRFFLRNCTRTKLLHSPRHPVDPFLRLMLEQLAHALGLVPAPADLAVEGFGFNQWPVITRHHRLFSFKEQPYFVIRDKMLSIEDVALGYYNFYDFNPHVVAANRDKAIPVPG